MADLISGDTDSGIRATLRRQDGSPFPLAGLSPIIKFRNNNSPIVTEKNLVVLDEDNGVVQYTFLATELVAGKLYVEFEVRGS